MAKTFFKASVGLEADLDGLLTDETFQFGNLGFLGVSMALALEGILGVLFLQSLPFVHPATEPATRGRLGSGADCSPAKSGQQICLPALHG